LEPVHSTLLAAFLEPLLFQDLGKREVGIVAVEQVEGKLAAVARPEIEFKNARAIWEHLLIKAKQEGYDEHESGLVSVGVDPLFDSVRSDGRFRDLFKRLRLSN
jgi:hypothetical protein